MHDSKKVSKLLLGICNCPNVLCAANCESHPCRKIVKQQDPNSPDFHLPEPWNGDLVNAPLLIISSNPSIGEREKYPTHKWENDKKEDFFVNRFNGRWTCDLRPLLSDGTYGNKVDFWNKIHNQAKRAFGREVESGKDYAITEVVHCKSHGQQGITKKALGECGKMWTEKIVAMSKSCVIMVVGKHARDWFCKNYGASCESFQDSLIVSKRRRIVLVVPHTASGQVRNLDKILTEEKIQRLNAVLL